MIPNDIINNILDRADLIDVVKSYGVNLIGHGNIVKCCCPFHKEKTPSMKIDNNKGLFYCFGCGEGGNVVQFVMKMENCDFVEAVKSLGKRYGIAIEKGEPETHEQRVKRLKVETMRIINEHTCKFYASMLWGDSPEAKAAREYIKSRGWSEEYAKEARLGLAPRGDALYQYAVKNSLNIDLMKEMKLIGESARGRIYDVNQQRLIIPIRNRANKVIGFTARQLPGNTFGGKYINSPNTAGYNKSESVFGIHAAINKAVKDRVFYLVEGAPDVMRLHSIGVTNTVASLGGAWTESQFSQLKKYDAKLCFIPDADPPKDGEEHGAGVKNVIRNGMLALDLGFIVTVKEIEGDAKGKNDPDSYITSRSLLEKLPEEDFILWYYRKIKKRAATVEGQAKVLEEIARLIAKVKGQNTAESLITAMSKQFGTRKQWKDSVSRFREEHKKEEKVKRSRSIDRDVLTQYGFYQDHNCYYSIGREGKEIQWSNFTMEPLFHIEDNLLPKRLYKIRNISGVEKIIELKQSDLTSLSKFSEKVEGLGNFIWLEKQEQLNKLKMYLYEQTETATEIVQLGWQKKNFWAWGNGVYHDGEWLEADDFGIVRLHGIGNFYLPAASKIYRDDAKLFQFERRFVHTDLNRVTLRQYTDKLVEVFGKNAKVGICFLLATLFRDVVTSITKTFPILNLFGQKGSGKSEMGHSLMAFFIIDNVPPNLQGSTDAALADVVAQSANALVHLDEYKNTIDLNRREFIKGLFDGTGRTRMNMDRDKKRETTAVDCGVILSGQEMPTIDIAIFSRLIYLTFDRADFTTSQRTSFNELAAMRKLGCSHLTMKILAHRKKFEVDFPSNYRAVLNDVLTALENEGVEDRILRSWVIPLAAFRTLEGVIDLAFDYKEMLKICIDGILKQNGEIRSNNELAMFWTAVDVMHQQGLAIEGTDYRIVYENGIKCKNSGRQISQEWKSRKPVLYVNYDLLLSAYQKFAKGQGDVVVPTGTLKNYLEVSPEYYGKKQACRFYMINNVHEGTQVVERGDGSRTAEKTSITKQAYCFDYTTLSEKYGINLEVSSPTDDVDPKDIELEDNVAPF